MDMLLPTSSTSANFTSILSSCNLVSSSHELNWVIDTGALDHMSSQSSNLVDVFPLNTQSPIRLSTGDTISITQLGIIRMSPNLSLTNVSYVPFLKT